MSVSTVAGSSSGSSGSAPSLDAAPKREPRPIAGCWHQRMIGELRKDLREEKYHRIKRVIAALSVDDRVEALKEEAPRMIGGLIRALAYIQKNQPQDEASKALTAATARKIIHLFLSHDLLRGATLRENVLIVCKDGSVSYNKSLLCLQSDYFRTLFASKFKSSIKDAQGIYTIDFSTEYRKETLDQFKGLFVRREIPDMASNKSLTELANLAHLTGEEELVSGFAEIIVRNAERKKKECFYTSLQACPVLAKYIPFDVADFFSKCAPCAVVESSDSSLFLASRDLHLIVDEGVTGEIAKRYFRGILIDGEFDINRLRLIDFSLSEQDLARVKELKIGPYARIKVDDLLSIVELFPQLTTISTRKERGAGYSVFWLDVIERNTVSNGEDDIHQVLCSTAGLQAILAKAKTIPTFQHLTFSMEGDEVVLPLDKPLLEQLLTTEVRIQIDNRIVLRLKVSEAKPWFQDDYKGDIQALKGALLRASAFSETYKLESMNEKQEKELYEFVFIKKANG